jgi:uncharacterized membrane protein
MMGSAKLTDNQQEHIVGVLLRAGVTIAAIVVLAGGLTYLMQHGGQRPNYHQFQRLPDNLQSMRVVVKNTLAFHSEAVIQLGLLLLILTPILRVALSAVSFAREGDRMYVMIALIVLAVLVSSLLGIK